MVEFFDKKLPLNCAESLSIKIWAYYFDNGLILKSVRNIGFQSKRTFLDQFLENIEHFKTNVCYWSD